MDRLRRIIIHKSENGYMFSIKDLGQPYSEAAPVNKVVINGPADSAGLRSGDGVVAINSNLVKGKTYSDLCNIIKSCRGTSLELTVIENYYGAQLQMNKAISATASDALNPTVLSQTPEDKQRLSDNSTPLSLEESAEPKYSPIVIKKKAYTYDKEALQRFSVITTDDAKPYNSAFELCFDCADTTMGNSDFEIPISGRYKTVKPKISYKKATNIVYKTAAKSDLDINSLGHQTSASDSPSSSITSSKLAQYDPTKVVYHQAYRQSASKRCPNSKSVTESHAQDDSGQRNRRGSTPVISDSTSINTAKAGRYSQTKMAPNEPQRKTSRNLSISKTSNQSTSPMLQLNRVGGFVRAPLSVDETFDLDDECIEDIDSMLNSVDTGTNDHSSATAATTESGRSSCDLDIVDSSSKGKFRHMHCSPMPYKSHNINNNSSKSLEITPTNELYQAQLQKYDPQKVKDRPLSTPLATSTPQAPDSSSVIDLPESPYHPTDSYQDSLVDDDIQDKDEMDYGNDGRNNHNSKHLKKLKNIFGDNYRCRSKTLDSDGKSKDEEVDCKHTPALVFVKWRIYDGKSCKSSWKQYLIHIEDDRLVFCREKTQNYLKTTSIDDTAMSISLINATVDDEPEKRGRKNTLRLIQTAGKQNECLIEFLDKNLSTNWLRTITECSRPQKDDKESRTASFKERHSLTVPNLYCKDSSQTQFAKSKTKTKDENVSPSQTMSNSNPLASAPSNKSVIHQAMSRVKNLKHKFASSGQVSDFERQQEEWFNKTGAGATAGKLVSSYSYSEDIQGGVDTVTGSGQNSSGDTNEAGCAFSLPLHKWQRSISSRLVPLVVELCVSIIETFGMNHVGLYRVSGNKVALDFISAELRKPLSEIDVSTDKWNDLHAISGVLKSFFRNLPDGLFPKDLYSDIIGACRMHEFDRERRLLSIQRYLSIMDIAQDHPEYRFHRETLRFLAEHLSRVASRQTTNRMTAKNLAVIFAPSLMKPPQETNQILVNDYRYKIQLMETLIKYHKWLFSPTLESACNIPLDSDDEDTTKNVFPGEELGSEQAESADCWTNDVTDARPLVRKILSSASKLSNDSQGDLDNYLMDYNEFDKNSNFTLAELSKQAYAFNSIDAGFKEVDIDEECERRKGVVRVEDNIIEKLKAETGTLLVECSKDIDELNGIQHECQEDLTQVKLKIKRIDEEIVKTERLLDSTPEQRLSPKKLITSQLFEISTRTLSPLTVALASPLLGPQIPTSESHKS